MLKRLSPDKGKINKQINKICKREFIDGGNMGSWSISNTWIENGPIL